MGCINRACKCECAECGEKLVSELRFRTLLLFAVYTTLLAFIFGAPIIAGLLEGDWLLGLGSSAIFVLLVWPVGLLLHVRRLRSI